MLKIVKKEDSEMHLREGPDLFRLSVFTFWSALCFAVGLLLIHQTGSTTISSTRIGPSRAADCTVVDTFFLGFTRQSRTVPNVVGAAFERTESAGKRQCARHVENKVVVVLGNGRRETVVEGRRYDHCISGDEARMRAMAIRINRFLASEALVDEFFYDRRFDFWHTLFPVMLILFGLYTGLVHGLRSTRTGELILRKGDRAIWRETLFFGLVEWRAALYSINRIRRVEVVTVGKEDGRTGYAMALGLSFGEGPRIGLAGKAASVDKIAEAVREFLALDGTGSVELESH